jgi:tetratricopeptide (TPR) repeat protein
MATSPGSPAHDPARPPGAVMEPATEAHGERGRQRVRRSGHSRRSRVGGWLANAGVGLAAVLIVAAPLAAGGVHRSTMIILMTAALACVAALSGGLALQNRSLRVGAVMLVPLAFALVPLVQSIPLPLSLRALVDSAGTALLRENDVGSAWPLSLDPPGTRVYVGRAAVALVVFLVAYHITSGQTRRHLVPRVVAIAGLIAVVIGIGHRTFGLTKLYGVFSPPGRALITGPFVNANHTATLLELSAFVCLACSFQRETLLNRVGWLVGTLMCAGVALATLSRGAVAALAVAIVVFMFMRYFGSDVSSGRRRRASLAWTALIFGVVVLGAASLGAGQLIDRFKASAVGADVRFALWRDGMRVFAAHPFGIGRGAFDRVFPIYRELKTPTSLRFAFVENEPLQLLIDCGWFFCLLFAVLGLTLIGWRIARHGRRDKIEAALVAGLAAVLVHSLLDFGLETLGVLVPFTAILGTVLGRLRTQGQTPWSARAGWGLAVAAAAFAAFGIAATAHRSYDDFDALLKHAPSFNARRTVLARAEQTHPLDYFYALANARLLPLKGGPNAPSPRLHALNRALRLCPGCETAHAEVARNLWKLGLRSQSLLEWRTAVEIQPALFTIVLGELFVAGAKPEELAAVASTDVGRALELVAFLSSQGRLKEAFVVLDQASTLGTDRREILLSRAELELKAGQLKGAEVSIEAAIKLGGQHPGLSVLRARLLLASKGANGVDPALQILDQAASLTPADLNVQRERIDLVVNNKKWNAAARSLEGLKLALFHHFGAATDAHIWAGRIEAELGHWHRSLEEYRIALADRPADVSLWLEYARAAETGGRDTAAREAYAQALRLSPNSADIASAQRALDARAARLRGPAADAPRLEGRPK